MVITRHRTSTSTSTHICTFRLPAIIVLLLVHLTLCSNFFVEAFTTTRSLTLLTSRDKIIITRTTPTRIGIATASTTTTHAAFSPFESFESRGRRRTFKLYQASDIQQPNGDTGTDKDTGATNDPPPLLNEVDVRHGTKIELMYDPTAERYIDSQTYTSLKYTSYATIISSLRQKGYQTISNAFLPEGVYPNYYKFIQWRMVQRFINAIVHVFGTQSLLMGLGIQNQKNKAAATLGLSAALNWVLKDALGKIVRMVWASKMGRKFDPDAKRWRYRSSLLFALGNGLEVMTYVFPNLFLVLATMANSFKQMSMLTSSATRNALYNSFRDGTKENIGDITAKGEAQIAIVDLFGIMSGVLLSREYLFVDCCVRVCAVVVCLMFVRERMMS